MRLLDRQALKGEFNGTVRERNPRRECATESGKRGRDAGGGGGVNKQA